MGRSKKKEKPEAKEPENEKHRVCQHQWNSIGLAPPIWFGPPYLVDLELSWIITSRIPNCRHALLKNTFLSSYRFRVIYQTVIGPEEIWTILKKKHTESGRFFCFVSAGGAPSSIQSDIFYVFVSVSKGKLQFSAAGAPKNDTYVKEH